ncbi:MAG: cell division protein FtsX [Dysgonomonas sp.]
MSSKYQIKSTSFFNANVTTTISITLVLILLGLTILIGFASKEVISFVKENLSISVELDDNLDDAAIAKLQKQFDNSPYVKKATYISKEEIKKELVEDLGRDPEEVLGYNPASSLFDIKLRSEYANADSIKLIEKQLKGKNLVGNFLYNEDDIRMVNSNLSKIGMWLFVLAVILMVISFTLIRNTIRLNIYAKRFLINTMRLVGATNSFIRKPFIVNFVLCGVIAGLLADILITALVYSATREYPELISIITMNNLLIVYGLVLLLGVLLTATATAFSVNRYLRMETNTLYHV